MYLLALLFILACGRLLHGDTQPLEQERVIRVAVVGDPNVGKSTLINGVLGRRVSSTCSTLFLLPGER